MTDTMELLKNERPRAPQGRRGPAAIRIPKQTFLRVSDWYHWAIRELPSVRGFESDSEWIARRLGLSLTQTREALRALLAAGLMEYRGGVLKKVPGPKRLGKSTAPFRLIRRVHLTLLARAIRSLEKDPRNSLVVGGNTLAIDPTRLAEANRRMIQFRKELMEYLQGGNRTAIYHLSMQLFRLDRDTP